MDQTGEAFQRVSAADKIIAAGDSGSPVNSGVNFSQQSIGASEFLRARLRNAWESCSCKMRLLIAVSKYNINPKTQPEKVLPRRETKYKV
jgi:hypothetical protein